MTALITTPGQGIDEVRNSAFRSQIPTTVANSAYSLGRLFDVRVRGPVSEVGPNSGGALP
jgi:hypothetical protein